MNCNNVNYEGEGHYSLEKAIHNLTVPMDGTLSIPIDIKSIKRRLVNDNDRLSLSEYSNAQRAAFVAELLNDNNHTSFFQIEKNVTKMFVNCIEKSKKFLIKQDYLDVFLPEKWTLACFNDGNHALKYVNPIIQKCFLMDVVYVNEYSLFHFARLSFPHVLESGLEQYNLKKIQQDRKTEQQALCDNPAIREEIKQFFVENCGVQERNVATSIGGGIVQGHNLTNVWRIRNDQDIRDMLSLPANASIEKYTVNNNQGETIRANEVISMFDFELFDDDTDLQRRIDLNEVVRECFKNSENLDYYTLFAVYPHTTGRYLDKVTINVEYLQDDIKSPTLEDKYAHWRLEDLTVEKGKIAKNIDAKTQEIVFSRGFNSYSFY